MATIAAVVASLLGAANAQVLAPTNDILFPSTTESSNPLIYSGGNTPWFAGPNVFGISNEVPSQCTVQQAAYVVRHGSRFPDSGSYDSWVALQEKIQAAVEDDCFEARGALSFIPDWQTVLTDTTLQMSQESMTGRKEAVDLGYTLRARYPDFYEDGNPFYVWANQYANPINESRVVQTAQSFLLGYMYEYADTYGTVVSVNSTGSVSAIGNSLGPSDACPLYVNDAYDNVTDWDSTWMPAAIDRINSLVSGNLTFDETDLTFFPYLCAYESQIKGRLSDWCGVFTQDELTNYAYSQDLSYYYGVGPGSSDPTKILFLPFLESLLDLLAEGPGQNGTGLNGTTFTVPNLIMAFLNDDQIAEMTAAMDLFKGEEALSDAYIPANHLYNVAHFITMRGTVAFEVLDCGSGSEKNASDETYLRILLNDAVYPLPMCKDGPGSSCLLSEYVTYIKDKNAEAGDFIDYCNVTEAGHPETVAGASFFTDLSLDFLTMVKP
ncbi:histidine acid phosphatase [Aspergillus heteromorphus CBS 117.55]|uniref:3-phytase n=1 Tax=Aspergillus heteromorphus CBS 117.55 TaxID=1448321 RepID=A0A317X3T8_9EURO|nr:histidine acid phosphatase [Aspergillus heteromorphus CBS 117.55]PWY92282.1 histidine acid phosphatase [Aspergillus heteromorphus CBS 117.55]